MDFLKIVYNNTDPWAVLIIGLMFGLFITLASSGALYHKENEHNAFQISIIWLKRALLIISFVALPLFAFALYVIAVFVMGIDFAQEYIKNWFSILLNSIGSLWWKALPLLFLPTFSKIFFNRVLVPKISQLKRKWSIMQTGDAASDVRTEISKLKPKSFDPRNYYVKDKHFYGLGSDNKPIYDSLDKYVKTHEKILGPSQTGKGVTCGLEIDQAIWRGWGCWFFNRKPDDFIPDIMRESCINNNREHDFIICDLNDSNSIGYHPFLYGSDRDVRTRAMKLFDLNKTGTNADHYKNNARMAFDLVMPYWNRTLSHLKELLIMPPAVLSNSEKETITTFGKNILTPLNELLMLKQFNPIGKGINIEECLKEGKVVLLNSSMNDSVIRSIEQNLIMEMIQICTRISLKNYVKVVIDEARFVMTEILADSLATVLSKLLLISLAYQSINDPKNLTDKTLNADSIKNGIETNTQTTISHRANDPETAKWVADLTGTVQKTVTKMERLERNSTGAEEWTGERSVGQLEENLITPNVLQSLPPMVSVLIRPNELATILYTCFIPVKEFLIKEGKYQNKIIKQALLPENEVLAVSTESSLIEQALPLIGDDPFQTLDLDDQSQDQQLNTESAVTPNEIEPKKDISLNKATLDVIDNVAQELLDDLFSDNKPTNSNKKDSKKSKKVVPSGNVSNKQETSDLNVSKQPNDNNIDLSSIDQIEGF